ncbi:hypothetical protein OG729_04840 [Streptomyces sp. NBC_00210]|uniref:hypothetical protein n=1 Tax=unclassified Streptomyces TaxID=2593676 RepID=UPI003256946E
MPHEIPRPPTMQTAAGYELQAAGYRWDAVRVPRSVGLRALEILGTRSGAVIEDPHEPALYWFVQTGAAAAWDLPDTRPLGMTQHVVVPPPHRVQGPGPHWRICPVDGQLITDVQALRAAVEDAAAPLRAPFPETT